MQISVSVLAGRYGVSVCSGNRARRFVGAGFLFAAALAATTPSAAATRYVFSTFKGDAVQDEKLSIYTSNDGLNFTLFSNTGYGGPTGVLRDPSLMKHSDGQYYIAYTLHSWDTNSTSFGIARSANLTQWTFLVEVPAQVNGAKHTWAPEWFKDTDGSVNLIVSVDSPEWDFKPYVYTATNDTLTQWSAPKPLGFGPNYIDTFIVTVGSTYHAFCKNETTKYIEHATATSLFGPWKFVGTGDWAGWGSGKEGIALFPLDNGDWRMFLDCYSGCGFLQATSSDLTNWSRTATVPGISGVRHGTVLREEDGTGGSPSTGGRSGTGGNNSTALGGKSGLGGTENTGGSSATGGMKNIGGTRAAGGVSSSFTGGVSGSGGSSFIGTTAFGGRSSTATKAQGGTATLGGTNSGETGGVSNGGTGANRAGDSGLGGSQNSGGTAVIGSARPTGTQTAAGASGNETGGTTAQLSARIVSDTDTPGGCSCSVPERSARATWVVAALAALGLTGRRRRLARR